MVSLILVIISIALMAAMVIATVPSINADAVLRQSIQKQADYGLHLLEFGVVRYMDAQRDPGGNIIYPGDGIDLKGALSPMYGFIPADVRNELTWGVVTGHVLGQPAVGICIYPKNLSTAPQRHALTNIQRGLPVGSSYLSSACNATSNSAQGTSLTYWIVVTHIN